MHIFFENVKRHSYLIESCNIRMFKRKFVRVDDHVTHTTKRGNLKNEMPFNMDKYIFV